MSRSKWSPAGLTALLAAAGLAACSAEPPETTAGIPAPGSVQASEAAAPLPLIPAPARIERHAGVFTLAAATPILTATGSEAEQRVANYLSGLLSETSPWTGTGDGPAIRLELDPALDLHPEGYLFDTGVDGVRIRAATPAGLFYGAVSLWQLATPWPAGETVQIPAVSIQDAPQFAWRGAMLDSARHMQSVGYIKRFIDWMALHKLNTLHWHLTDDQGWRLEILQYPRLTEAGAWRVPAGEAPAEDIDPATGEPRLYGGYYTQDEVREIVAHAQARHVTIVPEIDVPGHALAAIVAYPELGVIDNPPTQVMSDWGVYPYLFDVDEETFAFLENVLEEVLDLFPGEYIHIGGDEAPKNQWRDSETVQARMAELGIADEDALQGWFTQRLDTWLIARGRRLVGWDEIVEGGLSENATVMSWRGLDGAEAAAEAGLDAVIAPNSHYYLDYRQSRLPSEPTGRGRVTALQDLYEFSPFGDGLAPDTRDHILGLQANLWTEHMRTEARVTHMAYPRLAALAERAWSPAGSTRFEDFLDRLSPMMERYRTLGLDAADSAFRPAVTIETAAEGYRLSLANQTGFGEIRYTLDGSQPGPGAILYEAPLDLDRPVELRAAAFDGPRRLSGTVSRSLDADSPLIRDDSQLETCGDALVLILDDDAPIAGEREAFQVDIMDPCWRWPDAPLGGVTAIEAGVGQVPYNFQLMADIENVVVRPLLADHPELIVRRESCTGPVAARLDLRPALGEHDVTRLDAPFDAAEDAADLCFVFHTGEMDPLWVLADIRLVREDLPE